MWEIIRSNKRKSVVLLILLVALLVGLGYFLGALFTPEAAISGAVGGLILWAMLMLTTWVSGERVLLASTGARRITKEQAPQLYNIVEEMRIASGYPAMPEVYILDSDVPNAFAVGLKPKRSAVAVTRGLLARLNRDELQGVIAHEIGHLANRDTLFMTLAGVTVGAILILGDIFWRAVRYSRPRRSSRRGGEAEALLLLIGIVLLVIAPFIARLLYFACSRRREYLADASAAQYTRYPEGLASALEKIEQYSRRGRLNVNGAVAPMFTVNPLEASGRGFSLFSTHPPTSERIRILRSMGKSASLAAYEEAYRALHKGKGLLSSRDVRSAEPVESRAPTAAEAVNPAAQWQGARELLRAAQGYTALRCGCGLNIKVPAGFRSTTVLCPRCGTLHSLAAASQRPP